MMSLELSISIAMQMTIIDKTDNNNDAWGIVLGYFFLAAYGGFLVFVLLFYFCSKNPAERMKKYKARVGALYEGINYKKNYCNKLVTVIFIFKRIFFAATYFYVRRFHVPLL